MEKLLTAIAWTPCDAELPDDDIVVLVALDSDSEPVWLASYDSSTGDWHTPEQVKIAYVTHWAELPERP